MVLVVACLLFTGCAGKNDDKKIQINEKGKYEIEVFDKTPIGWATDTKCYEYYAENHNTNECGGPKRSTVVIKTLSGAECGFNLWAAAGAVLDETKPEKVGKIKCSAVLNNIEFKKEPDSALRPQKKRWFKKKEMTGFFTFDEDNCSNFWFRLTSTRDPYCNGRCYGHGADRVCW